jgi:hypothetical protein
MKRILVSLFLIAVMLVSGVSVLFLDARPVQAAGSTTVYINCTDYQGFGWYAFNKQPWNYYRTYSTSDTTGGLGFVYRTDGGAHVAPYSTTFEFNVSSIPDGAQIIDAKINFTVSGKDDNYVNYNNFYWSFYKTDAGGNNDLGLDDNARWYALWSEYGRQTPVLKFSDMYTGAHSVELTKPHEALLDTKGNNKVWLEASTEYFFLGVPPLYNGESDGNHMTIGISWTTVQLEVTYVSEPERGEMTLHENAAVDTYVLGNEVANNITLETLSCMYGDETLSFLVNGESGANVSLELWDGKGNLIDTHDDSVRVDGIYAYQIDLTSDYSGFVRLRERNFNLWSEWVSVQPSPSSSEFVNLVYARSTEYPQYTTGFSNYVVYDGDYMYIHWKTNINPSTELPDYAFKILSRGIYQSYLSPLDELAADYFGGTEVNQKAVSHWRYAIFTPALLEGTYDYGGLILNLNFAQARSIRTGFIQAVIVETSDNQTELAPCHSAYWYLSSADKGLQINLERNSYTTTETPVIKLVVGDECKVESLLSSGTAKIGSFENYFTAELGNNRIVCMPYNVVGNNVASLILEGDQHTYQYRYDMSFTITDEDGGDGTGVDEIDDFESWWDKFMEFIGIHGLDTPEGHWIILIIAMILLCAAFFFNEILRVVFPLLAFGAACVAGWIDRWWVILLALGAGVFIFSIFRKKTAGGEG